MQSLLIRKFGNSSLPSSASRYAIRRVFPVIEIASRQQSFSTRIFYRARTSTYVFVEQGLDPLFSLHLGYSRLVGDLEQTWCDLCQPLIGEMKFSFVSRALCFGATTYLGLNSSDIVHVLLGRQNERIVNTAEAKRIRADQLSMRNKIEQAESVYVPP